MINFEYQSAIVAIGVNLFLTVYVLVKNKGWRGALNRNFAFMTLTFACWNSGIVLQSDLLLYIGLLLCPPAGYGFLLILIKKRSHQERRLAAYVWLMTLLFVTSFLYFRHPIWIYQGLVLMMSLLVAIWGTDHLLSQIKSTKSPKERIRLWVVLASMLTAGLGGILSILSELGLTLPPLAIIGGLVFTVSITVAIMRHRLIDFGILAGRVIIIFIMTFTFWCLIGILGNWHKETPYTSILSVLTASMVLVMLYEPLTALVEGQTRRTMNREMKAFNSNLLQFSRMVNSFVTEPSLIKSFAIVLRQSSRLGNFGIFLIDPHEDCLICRASQNIKFINGDIIPRIPFFEESMMSRQVPLYKNEIGREIQSGLPSILRRNRITLYRILGRFKADICLPVIAVDQFMGFVTLGFRDPEAELTIREEESVVSVIRQFSFAVSHARVSEREKTKDQLAAIGQLASGLAHEIRNPLATINAAVQYLQPVNTDEASQEFFKIIRDEIDRLNRFVGRFLSYARPVPVAGEINRESISSIVNKLVMTIMNRSSEPGFKIEAHVEESISDHLIPGDAWTQIIGNLLENACNAIDYKSPVRITVKRIVPSSGYEIIVEDSGPGIPEELHSVIFRPFYTTRERGTGLGLAIVHQIVQNLMGTIMVGRSALGGALFSVKLPDGRLDHGE